MSGRVTLSKGGRKNREMLNEFIKSAITIRPWPLFVGLVSSALVLFLALHDPSLIFKLIPERLCGNTHTRLQWNVVRADETTARQRLYVVGGSQLVQGFPPARELNEMARQNLGDVEIVEVAYSGQSMLETLILMTHLPIDPKTVVLIQVSPYRLSSKARSMQSVSLLLDPSKALELLRSNGIDFADSQRKVRIVEQMTILATRAIRPWDKFLTEKRYRADPKEFVAGLMPTSPAVAHGTEGSAPRKNVREVDVLLVLNEYVRGRGGRLCLFEMPYNPSFPEDMPGWGPKDHEKQSVVNWLTRLAEKGGNGSVGADYNHRYYSSIREIGVPFISFAQEDAYTARDFYDSVHLLKRGREKFMPFFFKRIKVLLTSLSMNKQQESEIY